VGDIFIACVDGLKGLVGTTGPKSVS
jgi:hypothetical protein